MRKVALPRYRLSDIRREMGLSQKEVAHQIGTTYVNVSRWERGITTPSLHFQSKLCQLFNKAPEELDLLVSSLQSQEEGEESREQGESSSLPNELVPYVVGRKQIIAAIRQELKPGACLALHGIPGVGKTALVLALAADHAVRQQYEGILWAGLGPEPHVTDWLIHWSNLLHVPFEQQKNRSDSERAKVLARAIGLRKLLILIDDVWDVESVLNLKIGAKCTYVITTRYPDIAYKLARNTAWQVDELDEHESTALFLHLAGIKADDDLSEEIQKAIQQVLRAVGGLPLAITLLGKHMYAHVRSGQSRRVVAALHDLQSVQARFQLAEPLGPLERPSWLHNSSSISLKAAIEVSMRHIDEKSLLAIYALSVFVAKPNSFDEAAALAIADCSVQEIDRLYEAGLLEYREGRYTMHRTIADYARLHVGVEMFASIADRFVQYYVSYTEKHRLNYERIREERENITNGLDIAYSVQHRCFARGVCAFVPYLLFMGMDDMAERYLRSAVEIASISEKVHVLCLLGQIQQKKPVVSSVMIAQEKKGSSCRFITPT